MPIRQRERHGGFENMPQLARKYVNTHTVCALPLNQPIGEGMFARGAGARAYAQPEDYSTNKRDRSQLAPPPPPTPPNRRQSFLKPRRKKKSDAEEI